MFPLARQTEVLDSQAALPSAQCPAAGALEQIQLQAVREILKAQPHARIGLSYFVIGPTSRTVDMRMIEDQFGRGAVVCPAITAKEKKDRVCAGCRRCWAAHIDAPIIYPNS
jgi:hypothetical protein